ncbi:MAG: acetolactate decarboxylase [Armatimonadota bacterium]
MRRFVTIVACCLLLPTVAFAQPEPVADRDTLYQVSTLDALLAGVFDRASSISDLLTHGDIGLGCFEAVDGEMVVLDGKAWQVTEDGEVREARPRMGTPFAAVTFFDRDREIKIDQPLDMKALTELLDSKLPTRNLFTMIRLDGEFEYMKTRSVPRQQKPYPRLLEVSTNQSVFEYRESKGTVVALFCPYFAAGANMPGWHFHYLTDARDGGGHVLNFRLTHGNLAFDDTPRYFMSLPEQGPYTEIKLEKTDKEETEKIEKDTK